MAIAKTAKIDVAMLLFFIVTVVSGVEFHVYHHGGEPSVVRMWYILHLVGGGLFFLFSVLHVKLHWGWFKNLFKASKRRKHPTIILTVLYLVEVVTAILKLVGMHSPIGKIHWFGGLLFIAFVLAHFIRRFGIFRKGLGCK